MLFSVFLNLFPSILSIKAEKNYRPSRRRPGNVLKQVREDPFLGLRDPSNDTTLWCQAKPASLLLNLPEVHGQQ
jgi:hypothetical protein